MAGISPELVVIVMFGGLIVTILLGYPLAFCIGGIGLLVGFAALGPPVLSVMHLRILSYLSNYILLAIPLFVYMGVMMERMGAAERLYGGLYLALGGFRGGLAVSTIVMGTILAACVGVIAASVTMIGLIAVPTMLKRGYNKELICGSVCAGGSLGILIPPSIMLVIYGPLAQISVGKLFMGAIGPGLLLAAMYIAYIALHTWLKPQLAPAMSEDARTMPLLRKVSALASGLVPPLFIILAVLGAIFLGIATPTEAAASGSVVVTILAVAYRRFSLQVLKEVVLQTLKITSMIMAIGFCAQMFTGVFLTLGGGGVLADFLMAVPGGRWGTLAVILFLFFLLGFFIDWIGILFIMVPIVIPMSAALGFDSLWFGILLCVDLQMAFMTPPMAAAIFYLKGIVQPEWGIDTGHIIRGVVPFIVLILVGMALCIAFPNIILWLPHQMIQF